MNDYGPRGYGDYGSGDYGRYDGGRRGDDFFGRGDGREGDYGSYREGRGSGFSAPYDEPSRSRSSGAGSVRPPSPHDEPLTTGRARVPGADSAGPGRARGSARVGGKRAPSGELSEEEEKARKKAKKKKRRRRNLIALGCVMVMMIGIGTVAGSILFAKVPVPDEVFNELEQSTTLMYADGKEKIGSVGIEDRKVISKDDMPKLAKEALVAAEDRKYWEHGGVDAWGVMRAFVNNVTGGDQQGGSTLEQQYVGHIADMRGDDTYFRKAKEAVMAMKLGDAKSKDEIITDYLNVMPFGRSAFGIGAASEAFFGKKLKDLGPDEVALLIAQLKASGGTYDPRVNPYELPEKKHLQIVTERWEYVLDGMVDVGALKKSEREKFTELPDTQKLEGTGANKGATEDTGFVTHRYALEEARKRIGLDSVEQLKIGGYKITTTLDKKLQDAAVRQANHKGKGAMAKATNETNDNLRSGLVSVDPNTGAIVAYYGGNDGTGVDKAGSDSMHPPGSSFKEFTMVAALEDNISMDSVWDGSKEKKFPGRELPVRNAGDAHKPQITMKDAIRESLNTPIYAITDEVGANKVMLAARDMGITQIKDPSSGEIVDLHDEDIDKRLKNDQNPRDVVDNEIGFGQYPVSVKDMAVANATLAANGVYHEPHFVKKIEDSEGEVVWEANDESVERSAAIEEDVAADATHIISAVGPQTVGNNPNGVTLPNGQGTAAKTGTWERYCDDECNQNSAIWYTGYTPSLATAVWVGDKSEENGVVNLNDGSPAFGSTITGDIWWEFMNEADKIVRGDEGPIPFPDPKNIGDKTVGNASKGGDDDGGDEGEGEDGDEGEDENDPERCEPGDVECCLENPNAPGCTDDPGDPSDDPGNPSCNPEEDPICTQGRSGEPAANSTSGNRYGVAACHKGEQTAVRDDRFVLTAA
ncbi:MAG TPA: penicillin-binding protein [Candidatus Stackebrandtia faecavium]|nr:penicillin-binding protein [Candidatus Stackebrandtia faecavium]